MIEVIEVYTDNGEIIERTIIKKDDLGKVISRNTSKDIFYEHLIPSTYKE